MRKLVVLLIITFLFNAPTSGCLNKEEARSKKSRVKSGHISNKKAQDKNQKEKKSNQKTKPPETVTVILYFSDSQAMRLLPEASQVPKTQQVARAAIKELIKGPQQRGHIPTIPNGTELLSIRVDNDLAYVNFSKELKQNHPGGSAGERMTVYSIVNTLTEFNSVNKVQILIEGALIISLAGHMDLRSPIERDEKIIGPP